MFASMEGRAGVNWETHQENITILGMQGSGKTTLAKRFLDTVPNVPRLIISPQNPRKLYGSYGNPVTSIDEITGEGAYYWAGQKPDELTFNAICKKIMMFTNFLFVVDDAHEFCKKQKMPKEWDTLINSGRNRGITSIFLSPSPNLLNNIILQSSQILISFRFALESQIEYARKNFFGTAGWLLLTVPARPEKYRVYPALEKHDFLARSVNDSFIELHYADGKTIQLTDISNIQKEKPTQDEPEPVQTEEPEPVQDDITVDKTKQKADFIMADQDPQSEQIDYKAPRKKINAEGDLID